MLQCDNCKGQGSQSTKIRPVNKNGDVTLVHSYVNYPLKHTKNSQTTQKCLTSGDFVGAQHASK